jgi:hypothetical protein
MSTLLADKLSPQINIVDSLRRYPRTDRPWDLPPGQAPDGSPLGRPRFQGPIFVFEFQLCQIPAHQAVLYECSCPSY